MVFSSPKDQSIDLEREHRLWGRVRLAAEILVTYARIRRRWDRGDIRTVLQQLRDAPLARVSPRPAPPDDAARLARATTRVLSYVPADTRCLSQSLVLSALLARRGVASQVVISVKDTGRFGAHAWVELDGHPLLTPGSPWEGRLVEL